MKDIIFVVKICVFSLKEILKTKIINVGGQNVSRFVLNQCSTVILHLLYIFRQFRLLKLLSKLFVSVREKQSFHLYNIAIWLFNRYSGGGTRRLACVLIIEKHASGSAGVISNSSMSISSAFDVGM